MKVKIGNLANLAEARMVASLGADMAGFCLDKSSPRYVNPLLLSEIIAWLSGPLVIGEFSTDEPARNIADMAHMLKLDGVQISSAQFDEIQEQLSEFEVILNLTDDEYYSEQPGIDYTRRKTVNKISSLEKTVLLAVQYDANPDKIALHNPKIVGVDIELDGKADADSELFEKLDHWVDHVKTRTI